MLNEQEYDLPEVPADDGHDLATDDAMLTRMAAAEDDYRAHCAKRRELP